MSPGKTVLVGKRRLELSNLEKILYPDEGIVKAQVIEYYLRVAPAMLRHMSGRPLSLVRFPDGIYGEAFFQKNRPGWVPEWVPHAPVAGIDFMLASEEAALVFLANLAAIEFHQLQFRPGISPGADYMVFDLDPPEGYEFPLLVKLALSLRNYLDSRGFQPFVKTTGNKGLHLVVPLHPPLPYDDVFREARRLADGFVEKNPETTLHIKKDRRKGRVLVDIYRNRPGQTIVAAYSLRGKPGAPVSFPLTWEELESTTSSREYNLDTVPDLLARRGDAWEAMYAYASRIGKTNPSRNRNKAGRAEAAGLEVQPSLDLYQKKRSFTRTPEPPPLLSEEPGNRYVVHRHHASRLHYDLRLEEAGVLKSWAVPRGLPPSPGIRRLAIQVEDHPLKYVDFEGVIPKGQYGAGSMWVFSRGRYEITKKKKDGFYFRLFSGELTAEYRMIHTGDKQWLMERVDSAAFPESFAPMLAVTMDSPPVGEFIYEVKWDGIRAVFFLNEGDLQIRTRSGRNITSHFPELLQPESFRASNGIFDGEIVCLNDAGLPVFHDVVRRIHQAGPAIEREKKRHPAVCYLFDCMYLDGRPLLKDPLFRRREWLRDVIRDGKEFLFSDSVEDGPGLFAVAREAGLEGIMAKEKGSPYLPGKRSNQWMKVKFRKTADCLILGYTAGRSSRQDGIGALQLGLPGEDGVRYAGRVGSGFDVRMLDLIRRRLEKRATKSPPGGIDIPGREMRETVWVEPVEWCEIEYASVTEGGLFREPVFLRLRPDLA